MKFLLICLLLFTSLGHTATDVRIYEAFIGIKDNPLTACIVWKQDLIDRYKVINRNEYLAASKKTTDLAPDAFKRGATPDELALCDEILKKLSFKVAVNPRYPNNKTRPTKTIDTSVQPHLITGKSRVRAIIGTLCGKLIKPINNRYSYREILINEKALAVVCEK